MSEFSLIDLVGMSVFSVAFFAFKYFISFKISSLYANEKLKRVLELQFSLIAIMLGWFLYLAITLIAGSLMEAGIRYCKCYLFTGHNFVGHQWFNYFPKFFFIAYIFHTQILIIFSFTFSQKYNTQVPLFVIIDFTFLVPIFEKYIPLLTCETFCQ